MYKKLRGAIFNFKIKRRGFSLIELSIVILIIGIIIVGVTQGSRLVYQMKLSSARAMTQSSPVASIKGLLLWLEPTMEDSFLANEAEDTTELTAWKDINPQSASKITMIPSGTDPTGMTYVIDGINGLPSINFDISSDRGLITPSDLLSSGYESTVFIVYKFGATTETSDQYTFQWDSSYMRSYNSYRYIGTSVSWRTGVASVTSNPEIARVTLTGGSTADTISLHINGTSTIAATAISWAGPIVTASPFRITHGDPLFGQENFAGQISEIIVFEGALKVSDSIAVEAYLGKKYGIEVAN